MIRKLSNGMTVAVEKMPNAKSASFTILLQRGAAYDPEGKAGLTAVMAEMLSRGCAGKNAVELISELDSLGIERSFDCSAEYVSLSASLLPDKLDRALNLFFDIITKPNCDQNEFKQSVELSIQSILAIEDNPAEKLMNELGLRFFPYPLGRPVKGIISEIKKLTVRDIKKAMSEFSPETAILSIAGNIEPDEVLVSVEKIFSVWKTASEIRKLSLTPPKELPSHIEKALGAQVQIGLAAPFVSAKDPNYPKAILLLMILTSGMSSRLFVEVREKRGLVYAVRAFYSLMQDNGAMIVYAGTTPDKAEECIQVICAELERLKEGANEKELERGKIKYRSSLIMACEMPSSRAQAMAVDILRFDRVRSIAEMIESVTKIELEEMNSFLKSKRILPKIILTLGPEWRNKSGDGGKKI